MVKTNVIGPAGIKLAMRIRDASGNDDKLENDKIEAGWEEWGALGNCTKDGQLSWLDAQNLLIKSVARDG